MKTIEGHDVKIFTDDVEDTAIEQIEQLLAVDTFSDSKIRIMPDVHAGAGCVIGFTGDLGDKVIPNIVGLTLVVACTCSHSSVLPASTSISSTNTSLPTFLRGVTFVLTRT